MVLLCFSMIYGGSLLCKQEMTFSSLPWPHALNGNLTPNL